MSATGRRRIEKIEDSRTPRQAVLLWVDEASQLGSLRDYILSIKDGPDSAFPMFRLPGQVEQSVRQCREGLRALHRGVRRSERGS